MRDISQAGSGIVRLQFADGNISVSAASDGNEVEANVPLVDLEGEPNRIALNARYLLDYLNGKQSVVTMSLTTEGAPALMQKPSSPRVLVMPMHVVW